jgi:hypothetical protein
VRDQGSRPHGGHGTGGAPRGRTVRVVDHQDPDGLWAESDDVPGWAGATAPTLDELRERVAEGVRFALEDQGVDITDLKIEHVGP